jgi:Cys-Gly metallodipeptidase DUG1
MAEWLLNQLKSLGVTNAEKRKIGSHTLEGKEVELPPVIIGQLGNDPKKVSSSICVHGGKASS